MIRNLKDSGSEGATCQVRSHTDFHKWYDVVRGADGEWRCTCPQSFIKRVRECKHIDEAMTEVARQEFLENWKPSPRLYLVRFLSSGRHVEAVAIADSKIAAEAEVRSLYGNHIRIQETCATNRSAMVIGEGRRHV